MARINFEKFRIYTRVNKREVRVEDVREAFADLIYRHMSGVRGHALALKIYGSDGMTLYTDEEVQLMRRAAEAYCLPGFIDGIYDQLNDKEE